ncbi:hypothetical protein BDU57DRAFT_558365 [Ampelomyces quisqualis]|uniref:DUF7704 domain-containing protein n=1 Tax=Ampelomyces quisqualis TaxID=50730 RepID=A0A6A5QH25_AMPQU|nr:hypothetical protein BDU57DRAFT_558365 [Ampelomyces quisqualis]
MAETAPWLFRASRLLWNRVNINWPGNPDAPSSNGPSKLPKQVGTRRRVSISVGHVPTNRSLGRFHHRLSALHGRDATPTRRPSTACRTMSRHGRPAVEIPLVYRLWHLSIEPLIALAAAYVLHSRPERYFESMPRTALLSPTSQLVYTQLAACYVFLAAVEALVLRSTNDTRVWSAVIVALAVCDAGHVYATCREVGMHGMRDAGGWRGAEWAAMAATIGPMGLRAAFLLRVGFDGNNKDL